AVFPSLVDDGVLDRLDADGVVVDVQRAGGFAGRRADAAGELRKVVGGMQHVDGAAPVLVVDQIVPVRDDVVDRAAAHAERDAAIHAARALHLGLFVRQVQDELLVVLHPLRYRQIGFGQALVFKKSSDFSHDLLSISLCGLLVGGRRTFGQHAFVFDRQYLDEFAAVVVPVGQHGLGALATGVFGMSGQQRQQRGLVGLAHVLAGRRTDLVGGFYLVQFHHTRVATAGEIAVLVVDIGDAARHAGGEVAAGLAEHDDGAAGHVFAAVVTDTLHHCAG